MARDVRSDQAHWVAQLFIVYARRWDAVWVRDLGRDSENGRTEILFPTGKNIEREEIFHYSEEPVNQANFLIYVRKDDPIEWRGLETLNGLVIGVKRGFNYGDKWEAAADIKKMMLVRF